MIFTIATFIAAAGALAALILGADLAGASDAGVPWSYPAVGGVCLLLDAMLMWQRGDAKTASGRHWRSLATTWAAGAACASMVPLIVLGRRLESARLDLALDVGQTALLALLCVRMALSGGRMAWLWRLLTATQARLAVGFGTVAIGAAGVAIVAGPPADPAAAAMLAGLVVYAAPVVAGGYFPIAMKGPSHA